MGESGVSTLSIAGPTRLVTGEWPMAGPHLRTREVLFAGKVDDGVGRTTDAAQMSDAVGGGWSSVSRALRLPPARSRASSRRDWPGGSLRCATAHLAWLPTPGAAAAASQPGACCRPGAGAECPAVALCALHPSSPAAARNTPSVRRQHPPPGPTARRTGGVARVCGRVSPGALTEAVGRRIAPGARPALLGRNRRAHRRLFLLRHGR